MNMIPEREDPRTLTALNQLVRRLDILIDLTQLNQPGIPERLVITNGPVTTQGAANMQIHDNEQFDITVDAQDSKGQPTADTFTVTVDNASVISVVDGADGKTFTLVAGVPGSAVVTIGDGNLSATEAVDVVPGGAVTIAISEGAVSTQP